MTTRIYKNNAAQQTIATPSTWIKVTFNEQFYFNAFGENATEGMDALGFYDKPVNLSSNNAEISISGDYAHCAQIRCTEVRTSRLEKVREILERTQTGSLSVTYQGGGVARISVNKLSQYANVGNPTNPLGPWYLTNKITVSGCTDPAYNITGNIVAFDDSSGWIEYSGIVGTPSSDIASSATLQVGIGHSNILTGHSNVFSTNNYQILNILGSGKLGGMYSGDKIWLEFWHDETNPITLVWGQFDCYMMFRRLK